MNSYKLIVNKVLTLNVIKRTYNMKEVNYENKNQSI